MTVKRKLGCYHSYCRCKRGAGITTALLIAQIVIYHYLPNPCPYPIQREGPLWPCTNHFILCTCFLIC